MPNNTKEFELKMAFNEEGCQYCGQSTENAICEMCIRCMEGVVLATCRKLLMHEGRTLKENQLKKEEGKSKDKKENTVKELDLSEVLNRFPFELAALTSQFPKALRTEGAWFAHLLAYLFVADLRQDKNFSPAEVTFDAMYHAMRDQVYAFLEQGGEDLSGDDREIIENIYSIQTAALDGKRVVKTMLLQLEEMGRITIYYGVTYCVGCGAELKNRKNLCDECAKDKTLETRRSIANQLVNPLLPTKDELPPLSMSKGMHFAKKKD